MNEDKETSVKLKIPVEVVAVVANQGEESVFSRRRHRPRPPLEVSNHR